MSEGNAPWSYVKPEEYLPCRACGVSQGKTARKEVDGTILCLDKERCDRNLKQRIETGGW